MINPLSPRELEVLGLIARDFRHREIARHMGVGLATVRTYARIIYVKLDVHSGSGAVFKACQLGILPIGEPLSGAPPPSPAHRL